MCTLSLHRPTFLKKRSNIPVNIQIVNEIFNLHADHIPLNNFFSIQNKITK